MAESVLPFERQPKESSPAFEAFALYRDMGPSRSLDAVAQKCTKCVSLIRRWSRRWFWVERARSYDIALDSKARKRSEQEAIRQREMMFRRHAEQSRSLQDMASTILGEFHRRLGGESIEKLQGRDLLRLVEMLPKTVDVAQRLERLAVGEPLDNLEPPKPVEQMTDEELDHYIQQLQHTGA